MNDTGARSSTSCSGPCDSTDVSPSRNSCSVPVSISSVTVTTTGSGPSVTEKLRLSLISAHTLSICLIEYRPAKRSGFRNPYLYSAEPWFRGYLGTQEANRDGLRDIGCNQDRRQSGERVGGAGRPGQLPAVASGVPVGDRAARCGQHAHHQDQLSEHWQSHHAQGEGARRRAGYRTGLGIQAAWDHDHQAPVPAAPS